MKQLLKNQKGQGLTEYLILMLLICLVSIAAARGVGKSIRDKMDKVKNTIERLGSDASKNRDYGDEEG